MYRFCLALRGSAQQAAKLCTDPGKIQAAGVYPTLGDHDVIIPVVHPLAHQSETFPDKTPHAVAANGRTALSGNGRSQAPRQGRFFPGNGKEDKAGGEKAAALVVTM